MYNFNFTGLFIALIIIGVILGAGIWSLATFLFDHIQITVRWVS
jgi:hypothetical protein